MKVDKGMTHQEIFNKVYLGLKSQGFQQSWDSSLELCAYRGDDGLKCAAGWLIPDELYNPEFEGSAVSQLVKRSGKADPSKLFDDTAFVSQLQAIHDCFKNSMQERLEKFAEENGLEVPK